MIDEGERYVVERQTLATKGDRRERQKARQCRRDRGWN
jgi:hypothetical protein